MQQPLRSLVFLSILVISLAMHFPHFTKDLMSIHVWRQTQTQSTIVNFYEEDMNIFNPRRNDRGAGDGIFRMEFPLMQWLVAGLYQVLGPQLIISRLFMFGVGLLSVLGLYHLLWHLFRREWLALAGAWAFNFSPSFYYYTINPLPDNLALCLGLWGLGLFFAWHHRQRGRDLWLSGLLLSLAALCKLPFIVYFAAPGGELLRRAWRQGPHRALGRQGVAALAWSLLPLAWYLTVIPQWQGNPVVKGMLHNQASRWELLDYLQHNLVSSLPELLLNYGSVPFFLAGFYFFFRRRAYRDPRFPAILGVSLATLAYYLFEANAIGKIHDYYLFPFYPLLFMLVGYGVQRGFLERGRRWRRLGMVLLLLLPITCYLRMRTRWDPEHPGFNRDLLVHKEALRQAVPDEARVVAGNDVSHFIMFYYLDKKGWGFHDDQLSAERLQAVIAEGAEYLYTDAKALVNQPALQPYLDTLVMEKGSIRVYALEPGQD